jgi:hypothetical protein
VDLLALLRVDRVLHVDRGDKIHELRHPLHRPVDRRPLTPLVVDLPRDTLVLGHVHASPVVVLVPFHIEHLEQLIVVRVDVEDGQLIHVLTVLLDLLCLLDRIEHRVHVLRVQHVEPTRLDGAPVLREQHRVHDDEVRPFHRLDHVVGDPTHHRLERVVLRRTDHREDDVILLRLVDVDLRRVADHDRSSC